MWVRLDGGDARGHHRTHRVHDPGDDAGVAAVHEDPKLEATLLAHRRDRPVAQVDAEQVGIFRLGKISEAMQCVPARWTRRTCRTSRLVPRMEPLTQRRSWD